MLVLHFHLKYCGSSTKAVLQLELLGLQISTLYAIQMKISHVIPTPW